MNNIKPEVGKKYWWYVHAKALLTLEIVSIENDTVRLKWELYVGWVVSTTVGKVVWTLAEWNAAHLAEYRKPVATASLASDEQLCRSCNGKYFEIERDGEVLACIWCNGSGKQKKMTLPKPPNRRSGLHPELP